MSDDLNILQRKAKEWAQLVVNLHNTPVPKEFEDEKAGLINFARKIKSAIEKVTGKTEVLEPLDELGWLPVAAIIGVAGAAAAITKWTLDYRLFIKKVQERNVLISGGMAPEQAARVVNMAEKSTSSFLPSLPSWTPLAAMGAFYYFFLRK